MKKTGIHRVMERERNKEEKKEEEDWQMHSSVEGKHMMYVMYICTLMIRDVENNSESEDTSRLKVNL